MKSLLWCFHSDSEKCLSIVECHEFRCIRTGHSVPYGPIEREIIRTLYKKTPVNGTVRDEPELTTTLEDIPPSGKIS
jgi:hypothetical protein